MRQTARKIIDYYVSSSTMYNRTMVYRFVDDSSYACACISSIWFYWNEDADFSSPITDENVWLRWEKGEEKRDLRGAFFY